MGLRLHAIYVDSGHLHAACFRYCESRSRVLDAVLNPYRIFYVMNQLRVRKID